MALITRLSRLFKADFHAVIDQLEEPDIVLRQAVREMDEAIKEEARLIKRMTHESDLTLMALSELESNLQQTDEELDICFSSNEETLSKTLVKRKLEIAKRINKTKAQQQQLQENLIEAKHQYQEHQSTLESMQQKAALLAEEVSRKPATHFSSTEFTVSDADVEIAFLREKQKRTLS